MTRQTAAETARIYRTLGQLYLEPITEEQLVQIRQWAHTWLNEAGASLNDDLADPLRTITDTERGQIDLLETEFARLFRGVSERVSPDPPYESLYTEGSIYGSTTMDVRFAYREMGLDISGDGSREPADHLGIELQFLGELRANEPDAEDTLRERQLQFIENHPGRWIGDLHQAVEEADPAPFYRAVLALTEAFLDAETDRLE